MTKNKYLFALPMIDHPQQLQSKIQSICDNGYELYKTGSIFTFKPASSLMKYQLITQDLDQETLLTLDEQHYYFVEDFHYYHIVASKNRNAKDLTFDKERFKKALTDKANLIRLCGFFGLSIFWLYLMISYYIKLFTPIMKFYENAYQIGTALNVIFLGLHPLMTSILGFIKIKALHKTHSLNTTITKTNKIMDIYLLISMILSVSINIYFQSTLKTYFFTLIVGIVGYYMSHYQHITNKTPSTKEILVLIGSLLFWQMIPNMDVSYFPRNFPDYNTDSWLSESRYFYTIRMEETTTDESWIDDLYRVVKDENIIDDYFKYFIIETERGTRLSNSRTFTNMDLDYALSEKNVPSLSFEEAMTRMVEIDENVWICEDYLIAKKNNLFIRIAFEDSGEALSRLYIYINYYEGR